MADVPAPPWKQRKDSLWLALLTGGGAVVCAVAWAVVAERTVLADQVGWVSIGVAGLAATFAGEAAWLLRGRRALLVYRYQLLGIAPSSRKAPEMLGGWQLDVPTELLAGVGLTRYHRADCPIAAGTDWSAESRDAHESASRRPCGICQP